MIHTRHVSAFCPAQTAYALKWTCWTVSKAAHIDAWHSLAYDDLESYFYLFNVWDERNTALSWDDTLDWAAQLRVPTPRQLYRGPWNEALIRALPMDPEVMEGCVVRTVQGFAYTAFQVHLAKYVRPGHVQTDAHWMHAVVIPNGLRGKP